MTGGRRAMRLGVPAYEYPSLGETWSTLAAAAPGTLVVVDPADGPGARRDRCYVEAIDAVAAAGCALFGYVDLAYGARPDGEVVADVDRFRQWYPVEGIFLDRLGSTAGDLAQLARAVAALRVRGLAVAANPGQPEIDPRALDLVDHLVVFEGPVGEYRAQVFPAWMAASAPERLWHLVYEVGDESEAAEVVALARHRNAGIVHVSAGSMPNPWIALPPYWSALAGWMAEVMG